MTTRITGKNIKITTGMRDAIEHKLTFLDKFLKDTDKVAVTVSSRKNKIKIMVVLTYNHKVIKVEKEFNEFYEGLDIIVDKVKKSVTREHDLSKKHAKDKERVFVEATEVILEEEYDERSRIVKHKILSLVPMTEVGAIEAMEELGHKSYMFVNSDKENHVCMIYVRNDGDYGLIEAE